MHPWAVKHAAFHLEVIQECLDAIEYHGAISVLLAGTRGAGIVISQLTMTLKNLIHLISLDFV